jgi:hypothetical protein
VGFWLRIAFFCRFPQGEIRAKQAHAAKTTRSNRQQGGLSPSVVRAMLPGFSAIPVAVP